jgi:hypothetical protein
MKSVSSVEKSQKKVERKSRIIAVRCERNKKLPQNMKHLSIIKSWAIKASLFL